MNPIEKAVESLKVATDALTRHIERSPVAPEQGTFYETYNGSLVYLVEVDSDGDGIAVVLRGGHGVSAASGAEPGERYFIDSQGYFRTPDPGVVTTMSLLKQMTVQINDYADQIFPG